MTPATRAKPAADFASAAMVRVLAQGMRELGLNPQPEAPGPGVCGATVRLDEKRRLVRSALEQGGIGCLVMLGRGLHRYADEPTHSALVSARDAEDLFARWTRLERYIHSRHRVEVSASADRGASIVHLSRADGPPPLPAEDLVVLGVLVALLEAIGAVAVTARIGKVPVYPEPDHVALAAAARQHGTAAWTIEWNELAAVTRQPHHEYTHAPSVVAPQAWTKHAQRCFSALCNNLMNPLTLPALAEAMGESPRSLQRTLSRAGLSYTRVLAEARCSAASRWLMRTATPIAEVGFVCGYSDQPHFTRDFRNRVGMTPLRYRTEFCTPS